jgi:TIR domain
MNIFVSWSGRRSREAAEIFRRLIPLVLQRANLFMATENIESGANWAHSIDDAIKKADAGLVFLTRNNLNNPWLAFEVGALSRTLRPNRCFPILVDLSYRDLSGPFAIFQAIALTREDIQRLLFTLNADMESSVSESVLQTLFDTIWPDFAARIHSLVEAADDQRSSALQASDSEKLNFLIEELESLKRRISKVEKRV